MQVNLNNRLYSPTSFKSNITFDIGGSQREGSCKIYYATSSDDTPLHKENTTVNDLGKTKFEDSYDFINQIVKKIGRVQKSGRKAVKEMGYDKDENAIKNVTIFLPSYTSNNYAFYLPNHKNIKDKPLKDIDFRDFKQRMIESGIDVAPDVKIKIVQDAMGTGLAMTKRLYDLGMLNEGKYYTACITGGGCGISNIEMVDNEKVIIKSTGSGYLSQSLNLQKVSRAGASAPAVIENFCRAMGMNDELIDEIKSCHKAEFTTSESTTYEKDVKTEKLKELLLESHKFEIKKEDENSFTIRVKDAYKGKFNAARRNAIDKYCLALARLAIIKKNEGSNGMIITGKLAHALDDTAKRVYKQGIADWTMQHLSQSFNSYELDKMQSAYHFEVMCDDRFFIDNNTECGELAHLSEFVNPVRGNWLKLDIKHLKK
ncbi:hypothetical protein J6G99_03565 [bacterium]|nr:hypothetical protein [bacterium]